MRAAEVVLGLRGVEVVAVVLRRALLAFGAVRVDFVLRLAAVAVVFRAALLRAAEALALLFAPVFTLFAAIDPSAARLSRRSAVRKGQPEKAVPCRCAR